MPVLFEVRSATSRYPVLSRPDALAALAAEMRGGVAVADDFFAAAMAALAVPVIALPANESTKSLDALAGVFVRLRDAGATRNTHLWAVGGGAIQDVAAFAASVYMRGIPWTYLPTTLLGMVDSCIGGKSSINVGPYKNLIGTFHTPHAVIIDTTLTATLSVEQRVAGLTEAAKICYCRGPEFFAEYLALEPHGATSPADFEPLVAMSLRAKQWFVEIDEFDRAERLLLNLGHTFGHALEAASGYRLSHGIAVGVGMLCAHALSADLLGAAPGGAAPSLTAHVDSLLRALPRLPRMLADIDVAGAFGRLQADKKHESDHYRFVTFGADGRVRLTRLPKDTATQARVQSALAATLERFS